MCAGRASFRDKISYLFFKIDESTRKVSLLLGLACSLKGGYGW